MKISWMGHSAFLIETEKGVRIVTDPYEPGGYGGALGYSPIDVSCSIVTVSHQHADHSYVKEFVSARIIEKEGIFNEGEVKIVGTPSWHDNKKGRERGKNIIFSIYAEDLRVVHFGDLGSKDIDVDAFKCADIALIPIGGTFTIGAEEADELAKELKPKIIVPMHFKTPKLGFDIDGVDNFLKGKVDYERRNVLEVSKSSIGSFKSIVVLDYLR